MFAGLIGMNDGTQAAKRRGTGLTAGTYDPVAVPAPE
jgi:hypothetical protein